LSSETHRKAWSRPPIGLEFSIVMFTASGLLVRYLKVIEKSGYRYFLRVNGLNVVRSSGSSISQERQGGVMKFVFRISDISINSSVTRTAQSYSVTPRRAARYSKYFESPRQLKPVSKLMDTSLELAEPVLQFLSSGVVKIIKLREKVLCTGDEMVQIVVVKPLLIRVQITEVRKVIAVRSTCFQKILNFFKIGDWIIWGKAFHKGDKPGKVPVVFEIV